MEVSGQIQAPSGLAPGQRCLYGSTPVLDELANMVGPPVGQRVACHVTDWSPLGIPETNIETQNIFVVCVGWLVLLRLSFSASMIGW
jgi:hypothetical protein